MKHAKNISIVVAGLLIGFVLFKFMGGSRPPVAMAPAVEEGSTAYYIDLESQTFKPSVIAYGEVEPSDEISVSAEVNSTVISVYPDLKEGQILPAGTEVIKLDQTNIKLDLIQAQANLTSTKLGREQTLLQQKNLETTLISTRERLELQEQEYQRLENLAKNGNVSSSDLDTQKQSILSMQAELNSAETELELIPLTLAMTDAEIENLEASVKQKQLDLENTVIVLEETRRIGEVNISEGSYITMGSTLFTASNPNDYEVEAKVSAKQYIRTIGPKVEFSDMSAIIQPGDQNAIQIDGQPVRASEGMDSSTRMMGIITEFSVPVSMSVRGLYVEVILKGAEEAFWVVPRSAIHQDKIYLISDENTLVTEPVEVLFYQDDYAIIKDEPSNHRLIISSLSPAVVGMKIDGVLQADALSKMTATLTSQ